MTGADQVAVKGEGKSQQSLLMGGSEVGEGSRTTSGFLAWSWGLATSVCPSSSRWLGASYLRAVSQPVLPVKTSLHCVPKHQTLQYPRAPAECHLLGLDPFENM